LWSGINPIAAVDAIDVNSGFNFQAICHSCGQLCSNESFIMTVDNISNNVR